jgi:hypothetical protein
MLFPPLHNCDSVEKRRDVNVKDDGEPARDGSRCFADAYALRRRVAKNGPRRTARLHARRAGRAGRAGRGRGRRRGRGNDGAARN